MLAKKPALLRSVEHIETQKQVLSQKRRRRAAIYNHVTHRVLKVLSFSISPTNTTYGYILKPKLTKYDSKLVSRSQTVFRFYLWGAHTNKSGIKRSVYVHARNQRDHTETIVTKSTEIL